MSKYYWGIDLGGTKIECAVMAYEDDRCVVRQRIATEGEKGYQHVISQIKRLIDQCAEDVGEYPTAVGFGTPGTLDPATGLMKNCNSTHLNGQPLDKDLTACLGVPVKLANDANYFALAEAKLGAAHEINPNAEVVFGIIMGTGVGAGIVVNGKPLYGCHGIAGEWGHNPLEQDGAPCYCGQHGCVETVLSGTGLERFYNDTAQTTEKVRLPQIIALAQEGDAIAQQTLDRMHAYFGLAVARIINVIDPDVIVIGGGVGNVDSLYEQGRQAILPHLFNPVLNTQIVKPKLGDSAGVFGAAMLVKSYQS